MRLGMRVKMKKAITRTKRADSVLLFTIPTLELGEDPGPKHGHHHTYPPTSPGAGEVPDQVTRDIRHGETDNGEDVFDVERGRFGSVRVLLVLRSSLSLFCFCFYLVLIIELNQKFKLPTTHRSILLSASRSPHQKVQRGRIRGFKSGHSFPINSPRDDDFSSNFPKVDVGRRSRDTSFDSISNGRVKGMIASLERSLSSKNHNGDHDEEGGGRKSRSLNKSQRNSTSYSPTKDQRRSASYSHSPNETQCTLPPQGTVHDLCSFCAPTPGAGRGPSANTREESDTRTEREETIKSAHQARLLPYPPLLTPVHTGSGYQQAWIRRSFLRILGRHLLPQARALRSIKLQLIQQDCTSLDTPMRLYLYLPSQRDLQFPYPHSLQF